MSARLTRNSSEAPPNSSHQKCIPFWTAGMALFSMFFGAGNLVFPLVVGASSGDRTHFAVLGLSLSAVLFPLLGLFSMLISGGHLRSFFARFHPVVIVFLLFILHLSQGPVACLPRLVTLMHASCSSIIPAVSLPLFSVLICLLIFLFAIKPYRMVALLGTFLTPLLLLLMAILVFAGIYKGDAAMHVQDGGAFYFYEGLKGGYQTMDLIASLLFATIVIPHLMQGSELLKGVEKAKRLKKKMVGASIVAAGLLMVTYVGLCYLASLHSAQLLHLRPEQMLHAIAWSVLGPIGAYLSAGAVFLACFTTAISLSAIFAEYLRSEFFLKKCGLALPLLITMSVTAWMSNLGFSGLMRLIGPAMQILYPVLIAYCLMHLLLAMYSKESFKLQR